MSVNIVITTVDGRNAAPVDMVNIPLFRWFRTSQVVVWDVFHQQYLLPNLFGSPKTGACLFPHLVVSRYRTTVSKRKKLCQEVVFEINLESKFNAPKVYSYCD